MKITEKGLVCTKEIRVQQRRRSLTESDVVRRRGPTEGSDGGVQRRGPTEGSDGGDRRRGPTEGTDGVQRRGPTEESNGVQRRSPMESNEESKEFKGVLFLYPCTRRAQRVPQLPRDTQQ